MADIVLCSASVGGLIKVDVTQYPQAVEDGLLLRVEGIVSPVDMAVPFVVEPGSGLVDGEDMGFVSFLSGVVVEMNRMATFTAAFVGFDDNTHNSVFVFTDEIRRGKG